MAAVDRFLVTNELLEMVLVILPLPDLLWAKRVSRTWRDIIDRSATLKEIRSNPVVAAHLSLPSEHSLSGLPTNLHTDLVLHFDQPIAIHHESSVVRDLSSFSYTVKKGVPPPTEFPNFFRGLIRGEALRLTHGNEKTWTTLLPGIPKRFSWKFLPVQVQEPGTLAPTIDGYEMLTMNVSDAYTVGMQPNLKLPARIGSKASLLDKYDRGDSMHGTSFHTRFGRKVNLSLGRTAFTSE